MRMEKLVAIIKETDRIFFDPKLRSEIHKKGDCDYVTGADLAVSSYLQKRLSEEYPNVGFITEESEDGLCYVDGKDYWILDPIDGTTNFICGMPYCCISLALCQRGAITMGILYAPYLGELFTAEKGKGACLNGEPIAVSETAALSDALGMMEYNAYYKDLKDEAMSMAEHIFMACRDLRTFGSAALEFAYIACGRADVYLGRYLKPWDFAAGMLLVREAGGFVGGLDGKPLDLSAYTQCVLCTNGALGKDFTALLA